MELPAEGCESLPAVGLVASEHDKNAEELE
jgi:hypothetical protein